LKYHNFIKLDFFKEAYLHSALWTLILGKDEKRKEVVRKNLKDLGCGDLLKDPKLAEYVAQKEFGKYNANVITNYFLHKYDLNLTLQNFIITARTASDIYFKRVHEILELIKLGEGNNLAEEFLPGSEKLFIEPVMGIAQMIAIVKGWLGGDAEFVFNELNDILKKNSSQNYRISDIESARSNLKRLSLEFEKKPLAIALVSTETQYDTSIIINEALNLISSQIRMWKITEEKKNALIEKFSDYRNIFDAIVTFNDISKSRQKPYRDLYSTALSQLGLHQMRSNEILGIENSENGIISMRTSGIGLTVAIPTFKSNTQNLSGASHIAGGGIPEILLNYNCFFSF
jgi:beta-phosphoglucomutase-like phosphatase (HAD superfamily)